jgi:hypothetical protein
MTGIYQASNRIRAHPKQFCSLTDSEVEFHSRTIANAESLGDSKATAVLFTKLTWYLRGYFIKRAAFHAAVAHPRSTSEVSISGCDV